MEAYHEILLCLSLRKALSKSSAVLLYSKIKGIEASREAIDRFNSLVKGRKLVDGMILEKNQAGFHLDSGDRYRCITDSFLAECAPDWADVLRKAMDEWDDEADGEVTR